MFQVGETVVKPSLGICKIKAIRTMTVENQERRFYVLQSGDVKVMVPFETAHTGGLRYALDAKQREDLENFLKEPIAIPKDERETIDLYEVEVRKVEDTVKKRNPKVCADVMKRLFYKSKMVELVDDELKLFREASRILSEEFAYLDHCTRMKATNRLKALMTEGRKSRKAGIYD